MELSRIILYTDIDGTAASTRNGKSDVPEKTKEALRAFVKEGGLFSVASGRSHVSVRKLFPDTEISLPMIEANGAAVFDEKSGTYLSTHVLAADVKKEIYEYVQCHRELHLTAMDMLESRKVILQDDRDSVYIDYPRPMISPAEFFAEKMLKCAFIAEKEAIDAMVRIMNGYCLSHPVKAERSADIYLEVFDAQAGKQNGIREVRKKPGLADRMLVCVGDYYNDLGMLEEADTAACPKDAADEVKQLCDYISPYGPEGALADIIAYLRRR